LVVRCGSVTTSTGRRCFWHASTDPRATLAGSMRPTSGTGPRRRRVAQTAKLQTPPQLLRRPQARKRPLVTPARAPVRLRPTAAARGADWPAPGSGARRSRRVRRALDAQIWRVAQTQRRSALGTARRLLPAGSTALIWQCTAPTVTLARAKLAATPIPALGHPRTGDRPPPTRSGVGQARTARSTLVRRRRTLWWRSTTSCALTTARARLIGVMRSSRM